MRRTTFAELQAFLRAGRGFDAAEVLEAKLGRLHAWFATAGRDAAVVGVSGGIDSAVTLGLLQRVARRPGSPLRRVVGLVLPIDGPGATGQAAAAARAARVVDALGAESWVSPLGLAQEDVVAALEKGSGLAFDAWAAGQLLSVLRTPALYGAAALLQAAGHRAIVVGTTNRDEGAYLGFFGKASDGMVDLQPLADLHKAEVRALAAILGVPPDIIAADPTGDVFDGRTDAEMIGASYDEVEAVLRLRELELDPTDVAAGLGPADAVRLRDAAAAVDRLHSTNAHKYAVGSPAVFLDVLPRAVPGGWPDERLSGRDEAAPAAGVLPGRWAPPHLPLDAVTSLPALTTHLDPSARAERVLARVVRDVLTPGDCARLVGAMQATATTEPVGVTGVRGCTEIGSDRATAFSAELAADLWRRVRPAVPAVRFLGPFDPTDGFVAPGHRSWRVVGLSPVLRFMRYRPGGRHLCHYDAGFDYGDGRRTLMSLVLFLTDPGPPTAGGALRFVRDGQHDLPVWARDHGDWDRDTRPDEVVLTIRPELGAAVLFDHRTCHDVETWRGPGPRVIIRADVVYERVPDDRRLP